MKNGRKTEVICIGQVLMDCIIRGWDRTSVGGHVHMADSISFSPGGDAYNESVILSRLGHQVQVMCGLGQDLTGSILENSLKQNHVGTDAIVHSETDPTPVSALIADGAGDRISVSTPSHEIPFFHPDTSLFEGVKVVSVASLFRAPFHDPDTIRSVFQDAKKAGAILTVDTKLANCRQLHLKDISEELSCIDYIFPNEEEAKFYTKKDTCEDMADVFLNYGVKNVIIKRGENGCFAKNASECFTISAYRTKAVDGTGAGDNFAAGFISALIQGASLKDALDFAAACAAICVRSVGATTGVRSRQQVLDFLT